MKRSLYIVVVMLALCFYSADCFANENIEESGCSVNGKYIFSTDGMYVANDNNGEYSLITADGVKITVYSSKSGLLLLVHQISAENENFFNWFNANISEEERNPIPYDIYFVNDNNERIELSSSDTVKIQALNSNQHVSKMTYKGDVYNIPFSMDDEYLVFEADTTGGYYVISEHMSMSSPKTGGDSYYGFLMLLLLIIFGTITIETSSIWISKKSPSH